MLLQHCTTYKGPTSYSPELPFLAYLSVSPCIPNPAYCSPQLPAIRSLAMSPHPCLATALLQPLYNPASFVTPLHICTHTPPPIEALLQPLP
jgi:hypothetical protein